MVLPPAESSLTEACHCQRMLPIKAARAARAHPPLPWLRVLCPSQAATSWTAAASSSATFARTRASGPSPASGPAATTPPPRKVAAPPRPAARAPPLPRAPPRAPAPQRAAPRRAAPYSHAPRALLPSPAWDGRPPDAAHVHAYGREAAQVPLPRPVQSKVRVPLFAARTLNAAGQSRVTLSLRLERFKSSLRATARGKRA